MNSWLIAIAIVLGSIVVAGAVVLKPSDFDQCTGVISSDIERSNPSATLDPRDVRAQAARICAGYEGP